MKGPQGKTAGWRWALALVLLAVAPGCEDEPNTDELDNWFATHPFVVDPRISPSRIVTISPDVATVSFVGGQALFTASGGSRPYTWEVSNPGIGSISPTGANQARYTALVVGENNVIVYDRNGNAAIAYVSGSPPAPLSIAASPSATLTTDNAMVSLTVSGGQPPYSWTVADPSRGNLVSGNTGTTVVYRRYRNGDNAVTVTDGVGDTASLVINQP